jgi:transcriptional regulator with XRE-family HTH domain
MADQLRDSTYLNEPVDDAEFYHTAQLTMLVRAVRSALGWNQSELAERAGVSKPTLQRFEQLDVSTRVGTIGKLINAVRNEGVEFDITQGKVTVSFLPHSIEGVIQRSRKTSSTGNDA